MMLLIAIVMVIEIVFIIYSVIKLIDLEIELRILEFEINETTKELEFKEGVKCDFEIGVRDFEKDIENFHKGIVLFKKRRIYEKYKYNSGKRLNRYARDKYECE